MARLNYNHLRYFWAVAHEGNLTRAAEQLCVSQSAISLQIQKLETQLGHPLFERRGKQLVLTEAGQIALDHADAIFAVGDELVGTLTERGTQQQVLRVGALSTLSRNFQMQFVRPLLGRKDVEIVIHSNGFNTLLQDLEAHRIDVILANMMPPPRDSSTPWIPHRIAEQPVSLIGHPDRVARARDLKTLLLREPLILPTIETGIRTSFDAVVNRLDIQPRIVAEVDDMAMLRLLVRENLGLAVVPPIVVRDEIAAGLLKEAGPDLGITESFYAIVLSRRFPNPLLATVLGEKVPPRAA